MKKFKPMNVKNSSIRLPDEFLDIFLINDGDNLVIVEEDGRYYLRKTFDTSKEKTSSQEEASAPPPPPSIDEMMKKASEQFSQMPNLGPDLMKTVEDTLSNPEMMKKLQEMAKTMFKGFVDPNASENQTPEEESINDEEDDDEDENGFKIDIE